MYQINVLFIHLCFQCLKTASVFTNASIYLVNTLETEVVIEKNVKYIKQTYQMKNVARD